MSLERRLVIPVFLGLLASLLVGAALGYRHAVTKVRTEMEASLAVGRRIAQHAVQDSPAQIDGLPLLTAIIGDFDGDRHVMAVLKTADGTIVLQSHVRAPISPAPSLCLAS